MTITESDWIELEDAPQATSGRSMRRIHSRSPHDIFLSVSHPGRRRMLVFQADATAAEGVVRSLGRLPQTAGLELSLTSLSRHQYELQVVLTADDLREVFTPLVTDIAATAKDELTSLEALTAVVSRFGHWQNLLRSVGRDGLGAEARRGLFGEVLVLREHMVTSLPQSEAVAAWTGPTGANQDFQCPYVALEVKTTTARNAGTVRIASERQLDDAGTPSLLLALVTLDERRGGLGQSLNTLVDQVRTQLANPGARARFDGLLIQAGYLPGQRDLYDEPRYTPRDVRFWEVRDGFPRIVESELPVGVSDCSYGLALSGLDQYRLSDAEVDNRIRGKND
ncbi:PD-(D/E)XK motif protein [Streptomyces durbertensis]|uniref:PD-(D/E)XK motif protein n=1 Tax=Streptomyces durbertensis TaxID=2448886 RepID=A0ABR6EAL1_9ACTN|nr:PD-(D/E)XK motif protein [Streptomyces durbertensis]MBB1242371.1 PD-(D/E)XK motif protein [Streptomyces durbertensis]